MRAQYHKVKSALWTNHQGSLNWSMVEFYFALRTRHGKKWSEAAIVVKESRKGVGWGTSYSKKEEHFV